MPLTDEQLKDLDRMAELMWVVPDGTKTREYAELATKLAPWLVGTTTAGVNVALRVVRAKYGPLPKKKGTA